MTLPRAQPDSVWSRGYVPTGVDFKTIDQNTFVAVNGDDGGSWNAGGVGGSITIQGASVGIAGPWLVSTSGLAPGKIASLVSANATIAFGKGTSDDYFAFGGSHPGKSQTPMQPCISVFMPLVSDATFVSTAVLSGIASNVIGAQYITPVRVYGGGTITSVVILFAVGNAHAGGLPQQMPRFRVFALGADGTQYPLRAADPSTDANGFIAIGTPASGAAWYNSGNPQQYTYACNQNQVIDLSKYEYFLEVIDENGTNAKTGNVIISTTSLLSSIALLDGRN